MSGMSQDLSIFVARQPIFDRANRVVAYELLFRSGAHDMAAVTDGDMATGEVLAAGYLDIGLPELTAGKRAYINFGRELILNGTVKALPPSQVVVEILEDVVIDRQLLEAVQGLKSAGYTIALDDYVGQPEAVPLMPFVDVVKVDLLGLSGHRLEACRNQIHQLCGSDCLFLAEKVEDRTVKEEAQRLGFDLFQGFFFSRPQLVQATRLPGSQPARSRLLRTFSLLAFDLTRLEETIKSDVSLTTRLLRYINAAAFPWAGRVRSVRHALVLLGENNIRKWVALVALGQLDRDKPWELAVTSNVRGRFCESVGPLLPDKPSDLDCFLSGALSILDAMVDQPMEDILQQVPVSPPVREALLKGEGVLSDMLELSVASERGDWQTIHRIAARFGISEGLLADAYREAILWSDRVLHLD